MYVRTVDDGCVLPDDLVAAERRLAALEARPPGSLPYLMAQLGPVTLSPNRPTSTLSGWLPSINGGARGITVADAGFLVQPGAIYQIILMDTVAGPGTQPGITYTGQRSTISQTIDRPPSTSTLSYFQTLWVYVAELLPNDLLVINCANTSSNTYTLNMLRALWIELWRV